MVTVERSNRKFPQLTAIGVNLKNLIYLYINLLTLMRVLFFHALITLYGSHTWRNRVNFSCRRERLGLPWRSCGRVDWRGSLSFFCHVLVCTHKNILCRLICGKIPIFALMACRLYVSPRGLGTGIAYIM